MAITRVVANITRHETVTYMFDGYVDMGGAYELIQSGEYDPDDSNIRVEDVDIVAIEARGNLN